LCKYDESGQTLLEYLSSDPLLPSREKPTLYVQPIGEIDLPQARVIAASADLLGRFYCLPIRVLDPMDSGLIPAWARRRNKATHNEQFLARCTLNYLAQNKPTDAVAVPGLTTTYLWPGNGWNYMFGHASFGEGVGVWSVHRMRDPNLKRALVD
jgi:archaemetzincin